MFRSKYSTILTVILIVLIIAIITIAIIFSVKSYKNYKDEQNREKVISELQSDFDETENTQESKENEDFVIKPIDPVEGTNNTVSGTSTSRPRTRMYKNYPMAGTIKIPKTNVNYPILLDVSPAALEVAVGVMYPSNPKLNEPGNTVIIGHNYRNGKFFSNNKKLALGDTIEITDLTGRTLIYKIYEIFTIPDTNTEYITRDRGQNTEISISTCTDDGNARLVILAKAE